MAIHFRGFTLSSSPITIVTSTVFGALALAGSAAAATATVSYSINAGVPQSLSIVATTTVTGNQLFSASTALNGVTLTWNYAGDLDPEGIAVLNGSTTIKNDTALAITVMVDFEAAICPGLVGDILLGGSASIKLIADAGGGVLGCGPLDNALVCAISDGTPMATPYYCPFSMAESGAGTISTSTQFGTPFPSLPGPDQLASLGHRINVLVSPGDKAILSLLYIAKGVAGDVAPPPCPGDVTEDQEVNSSDLLEVLSVFGATIDCTDPTDTNADGTVDGVDLANVIGAWGKCPG